MFLSRRKVFLIFRKFFMFVSFFKSAVRLSAITIALSTSLAFFSMQSAVAADQCTTTNSSTANAALSIGAQGALLASQMINGVLITEGQIGAMADRILWTELQIGAMANRIVYVTQFSQTNSITAIYMLMNPVYLGKVDGQYKYSGTLVQVPSKPFGW
jgi:hypothetical protein